jgi:hypothetical protein
METEMNQWELIDKHSEYIKALFILIVGAAIVILLLFFIVFALAPQQNKSRLALQLCNVAEKVPILKRLIKPIKRNVMKKSHSIIFASSVHDNERAFIDINDSFVSERKIVCVEANDSGNFSAKLGPYNTIVYKVLDEECTEPKKKCEDAERKKESEDAERKIGDPLYKQIARYCSGQHKHCILFTNGKQIDINDPAVFNTLYITTVNYYSKLRETLHISLLYPPLQ